MIRRRLLSCPFRGLTAEGRGKSREKKLESEVMNKQGLGNRKTEFVSRTVPIDGVTSH